MKYLKFILTTTLTAIVLNTTYVVAQEVNNNTAQTPQKLDTKALDAKIAIIEVQIKELKNSDGFDVGDLSDFIKLDELKKQLLATMREKTAAQKIYIAELKIKTAEAKRKTADSTKRLAEAKRKTAEAKRKTAETYNELKKSMDSLKKSLSTSSSQ